MKSRRYRRTLLLAGMLICLLLATAAFLRRPSLPPATVATVARIPLGTAPGQLADVGVAEHIPNQGLPGLAACDVDDAGNVYVADKYGSLYFFGPEGKPPKILNRPVLALTTLLHHAPQTLWAATESVSILPGLKRQDTIWGHLVKMTDAGQPIWELGQPKYKARQPRVLRRARKLPPVIVPPLPSAPAALNANVPQIKAEDFLDTFGLFASDNGDLFVINGRGRLERFNKDGKFLGEYDPAGSSMFATAKPGQKGIAPSVLAARDGIVYSYCLGRKSKDGLTTELQLERWTSPTQHTSQTISLAPLGPVTDIFLRAEDGKGNLYFQYYNWPHPDRRSAQMLPEAIARVGPDGVAREVFDVYAHYKDEINRARYYSPVLQTNDYNIRVGDLLHASPNGDLYLEVCDGNSYRVDKIAFGSSAAKTP